MEQAVWQIVIVCLLLTLSAIAKSIQDTLDFYYWKSIFINPKYEKWLNPNLSWTNKRTWFPNSKFLTWIFSNPLVLFTDGWHTFGFIRDFSIYACIPIITNNYWWFLGYPIYRLIFHIFFTYIWLKPKKEELKNK